MQTQIFTEKAGLKAYGSYLWGFFLALILTFLAFAAVVFGAGVPFKLIEQGIIPHSPGGISSGNLPEWAIISAIVVLAILQILVHLRYFLHLGFSNKQRHHTFALLFTSLILFIMVGGTIWVIYSLNVLMMPGMAG